MSTFLGQTMTQDWQDFPIWEIFFQSNQIKTFVELGTGEGGMSLYFALQCKQRGILFHTFDNQQFFDFDNGIQKLLGIKDHFHFCDIFKEGKPQIENIIKTSPHPIAMYFDDGDKPREWATFGPMLSPGDFCIVHDWGEEFWPKDIGDLPVERILTGISDLRRPGWKSMWFRRIASPELPQGG